MMLLCSCNSQRQLLHVVREVRTDTVYINKVHYDSIYISHDRTTDYHRGFQSNESTESVQSVSSVFSDNCQQNPSAINNQSSVISICSSCPRKHYVNHNTVMPCFCPMIKPGNGIHSRHDGSILVGHRQCQGLLIHPREVFATLYDRLRMTIQRGNEVTLKIINA